MATDTVYQAALDSAQQWIAATQNPDGSWGNGDSQRNQTVEVIRALQDFGVRTDTYYRGITWLENHHADNIDYSARRVTALKNHDDSIDAEFERIISAQSNTSPDNNGWGLSAFYNGSALDTARALTALDIDNAGSGLQAALDYLKSTQSSGPVQGWGIGDSSTSDVLITAMVVRALVNFTGFDLTLATLLDGAVITLGDEVTTLDPVLTQAYVATSLLASDNSSAPALALLDSLAGSQSLAGDWDNDAYTTAIVIQGLSAALGLNKSVNAALVFIADANLRLAINTALGENRNDSINQGELASLVALDATGAGIADLTGLEFAINLITVELANNNISDITPLTDLTNLAIVNLSNNPLSDQTDGDGDGLSDAAELISGTNPLASDTDGDGFDDGLELAVTGADPLDPLLHPDSDFDSDGYSPAQGDPDDTDNTIYPGATEICGDGIDQDVDGSDLSCGDGDINVDGVINGADILLLQRILTGLLLPTEIQRQHGDLYPTNGGDGELTQADLLLLWQLVF